jgi:putative ABC transport system substrate-binding protein
VRRREFITLLGGVAAGWPLSAGAQQPAKLPTIGLLAPNTPSLDSHRVGAFVQRLRDLGWIEGRTVAIEYRWTEGRNDRLAEIATEIARLKVDVIVTAGPAAITAAGQAAPATPIVFAIAGDAVGTGMVGSLARPGGNVTGLSIQHPDTAGKRLELLREVVPGLRRLAIMANVGFADSALEMGEVQATALTLGFEIARLEIRRAEILPPRSSRSRAARTHFISVPTRL